MNLYVFSESFAEIDQPHFTNGAPLLLFDEGRPLTDRIHRESINLRITELPPLDFFCVGSVPYVSESLKTLFDIQGTRAEYFLIPSPAQHQVFAFNALVAKNCFDRDRTTYETCPVSGLKSIRHLVLDAARIPDAPLFRACNPGRSLICINESLMNALNESNLKGFIVTPVEHWTEL